MKKILAVISIALGLGAAARAQFPDFPDFFFPDFPQQEARKTVQPVYDADFQFYFDNREFDTGGNLYTNSMTIGAARLTPSIGLDIRQDRRLSHRLMLGVDIMKNLGESPTGPDDRGLDNSKLFRELTLYYTFRMDRGENRLGVTLGIMPKKLRLGSYGDEFISDSLAFYDNNIEGALITLRRPRAVYELGCDWMGMQGHNRRERFMIFSYGEGMLNRWLSAGWTASVYHMANSLEVKGVMDNILLEPFLRADLGRNTSLQKLEARIAWVQAAQRNRLAGGGMVHPYGGKLDLSVRNWNLGVENSLYVGTSLMPFYNDTDEGGYKYGSMLYRGSPFYRIHREGNWKKCGAYDMAQIYWEPRICAFMDLKISALFHFAENEKGKFGYQGCRQKVSLVFNLDRLLHPQEKKADRVRARLDDIYM